MKLEVTRDVVTDLWPLYEAKEASADSRTLVEAYLAGDDAFRSLLRGSGGLKRAVPELKLSPDAEKQLLDDARARAQAKLKLVGGSIVLAWFLAAAAIAVLLFKVVRG
ncbi:MAG: hypothetical protein IPM94_03380 [bacterium]|nr:hypothetical protein [bacterium]